MALLLSRLARFACRNRHAVLAAWVIAAAGLVACMAAFGGLDKINQTFTVPGSQSQQALDRLGREFPGAGGTSAQVVLSVPAGRSVTAPAAEHAADAVLTAAATAPDVIGVVSPYRSGAVSPDRLAAIVQVDYALPASALPDGALTGLEHAVQSAPHPGLAVSVGGPAFSTTKTDPGAEDLIGGAIAVAVLATTFGSLFAAGMPLLAALFGVVTAVAAVLALTETIEVSSTALTLTLMVGMAVGLDYALFIVTRHRSQLARGMGVEDSIGLALGTAGSSVFFAGLTVMIALSALALIGIPFLTVMGLCAAGAVVFAVAVALTLLPAVLALAGQRLTPKPHSHAAHHAAFYRKASKRHETAVNRSEHWARLVTRRPLLTVLAALAAVLVCAWPARSLDLTLPDNGAAAAGSSQRIAYDQIEEHFGPGFNGPLLVLADTSQTPDPTAAVRAIARTLASLPDVAAVLPPLSATGGHDALIELVPRSAPDSQATENLVNAVRGSSALRREGAADLAVTGSTAVNVDVSSKLGAAMIPFAAVVVGLSLVLLLLVFRSLVIPVKAAVGFMLSVTAALGVTVWIYQEGHLARLVGVDVTGPITSFLPIVLMALLFGLAMDYEVFLVSRMRENYALHDDPDGAVHAGIRNSGRVVLAAALIMFAVFASFITANDIVLKQVATALALGVLVDAFLIRLTLVPAVLTLAGRAAWWLPRRLERILPDLDIEGARLRAAAEDAPTESE